MEEVYTVKVRAQPDAARLYPSERRYSASTVGGLGAVHLALAATCVLLAALDMAQPADLLSSYDWTGRYGGGAWLGIAAAMAGLTGILAWRRWYIDNNIRWFFICSCIAGITALLCLVVTAAALAVTQEQWVSTRLRVLSSLREQHLHFPQDEIPTYSEPQSSDTFEVQRSLRNAEFSSNGGTNAMEVKIDARNVLHEAQEQKLSVSQETHLQPDNDGRTFGKHTAPIIEADNQHYDFDVSTFPINVPIHPQQPQDVSHDSPRLVHSDNSNYGDSRMLPQTSGSAPSEIQTVNLHKEQSHHVSVRQAVEQDQFVDENFRGEQSHNAENEESHVLDDNNMAENLQSPTFDSDHRFLDSNALYLHRHHDDTSIPEDLGTVSLSGNETNVNKSGQSEDKYIYHKHLLSSRGGETRFVIVINLLVASLLEIAWSILSAKIAWKGMKSGYPDDGPSRTDTLPTVRRDGFPKEKSKARPKKIGGLRKPDIISNHDGSKLDVRRKSYYKEERKDPSLPMQESPTEYQERVRRFLASNALATVDGGMD